VVAAFDEKGVPQPGERHAVEMELKPATYEAVRTGGVRLFFRLKLPAGRYQVRAAAHETGAGATGSVHHDVEVPDYAKEVPGVSGIILTATRAGRTATARADEQLGAILPTPATARRRFGTDEELTTYIELYPDPKNPGVGADVLTSLVAPDGKVAFRATEQVSGETLRDAPIGYGWRLPIPLRDVAPGIYVLRMEVRWRGAERAEVREVILEVATGDY
jgi:hypothetical protein